MKKLYIILLIILLATTSAYATDYYVDADAAGGGDGSISTPWNEISDIGSTPQPGDTVYFDSADSWQPTSGSCSLTMRPGVHYIGDEYGSGSQAEILGHTGVSTSVVCLDSDNNTYETILEGFEIDGNSATMNLISFCKITGCSGSMDGAAKKIIDNYIHSTGAGNYYYGIQIQPHSSNTVDDVEIIGNEFTATSWSAIAIYPWYSGGASQGTVGNVLVRDNYIHDLIDGGGNCGIMVNGGYVHDVIAEFNYIDNIGTCYGFEVANKSTSGINNYTIRYNVVTDTDAGIDVWNESSGPIVGVYAYGNIFYSNHNACLRFASNLGGDEVELHFNNNICYRNGTDAEVDFDSDPNLTTFEMKNNIFDCGTTQCYYDANDNVTSHSNNIYYRSSGTLVNNDGTSYTSGTITTFEASAISSDPNFKNTSNPPTVFTGTYGTDMEPNNDGFSIESGDAINAGVDLGGDPYYGAINLSGTNSATTRDTDAGWDIGAYELTGGDVTAPVMSNPLPSGTQSCSADPQSVSLQITTDENATCKYDTSDTTYDLMSNTYSTTGVTSHSQSLSLACGAAYTYYSRCKDGSDNKNGSSETHSFSISPSPFGDNTSIGSGGSGVSRQ